MAEPRGASQVGPAGTAAAPAHQLTLSGPHHHPGPQRAKFPLSRAKPRQRHTENPTPGPGRPVLHPRPQAWSQDAPSLGSPRTPPAPALAFTTSVPASWIRPVSVVSWSWGKSTLGVHCKPSPGQRAAPLTPGKSPQTSPQPLPSPIGGPSCNHCKGNRLFLYKEKTKRNFIGRLGERPPAPPCFLKGVWFVCRSALPRSRGPRPFYLLIFSF